MRGMRRQYTLVYYPPQLFCFIN